MKIVPIEDLQFPHTKTNGETKNAPDWGAGTGSVVFESGNGGKHGRVVHVAYTDGEGRLLYDGMLRAERGGAVDMPVDGDGRFGLQKRERPQTTLSDEMWKQSFDDGVTAYATLGRMSWEVPRGFSDKCEKAAEAARREAEEETGLTVLTVDHQNWVCDNTACSPHMSGVFRITVGDPNNIEDPDAHKALTSLTWLDASEVLALINSGDLYCGFTLAAMTPVLLERVIDLEEQIAQLKAQLR